MGWNDFVDSVFDTGADALDIWTKKQLGVSEIAQKTGVDNTPATKSGVAAPVTNVPAGYGIESFQGLNFKSTLIFLGLVAGTIVLVKVLS